MSRVVVIADRDKAALVRQLLEGADLELQLFVPERGMPDEPAAALVAYREAMQRRGLVGLLAAGAAHDINNLVMALSLRVDELRADTDTAATIDDLAEGLVRIRDLCRNLTAFAGARRRREDVDLATVAAEATSLVAPLIRPLALLDVRLDCHPLPIHANSGEITQVVVNLLINAAQAIEHSGVGKRVELVTERVGDEAILRVSDDGPGMTAEQLERAFEPFVSWGTSGSGLGLYLCRHFITSHGGSIQIDGGDDCGTEVIVRLPLQLREP